MIDRIRKAIAWRLRPILHPFLSDYFQRKLEKEISLSPLFKRRPVNSIPPDWCDLYFLYKTVRKEKPSFVFEFGSGCSTYVILRALQENDLSFTFFSFESDEHWLKMTKGLLCPFEGSVNFIHSNVVTNKNGFTFYTKVPNIFPDFVYIDGPTGPGEGHSITANAYLMSPTNGAKIIVDGRRETVEWMKKNMAHYKVKERYLFNNTVFTTPKVRTGTNLGATVRGGFIEGRNIDHDAASKDETGVSPTRA